MAAPLASFSGSPDPRAPPTRPASTEQVVTVPEQPIAKEIGWFQAYAKECRGWLNPQELLPELGSSGE